jgi:uncharacterized protein
MAKDLNTPLDEDDIDTLDSFLATLDGPIISFEGLDGLFCALLCAPTMVMPSQYLEVIMDEQAFADKTQAQQILLLMTRHWNALSETLQQASINEDVYVPALLVDESGQPTGNDWAEGFLLGLSLTEDDWQDFIEDKTLSQLLLPMLTLGQENHPDTALRPPPLSPKDREDLLDTMFDGLMVIYEHFQRKAH